MSRYNDDQDMRIEKMKEAMKKLQKESADNKKKFHNLVKNAIGEYFLKKLDLNELAIDLKSRAEADAFINCAQIKIERLHLEKADSVKVREYIKEKAKELSDKRAVNSKEKNKDNNTADNE